MQQNSEMQSENQKFRNKFRIKNRKMYIINKINNRNSDNQKWNEIQQ